MYLLALTPVGHNLSYDTSQQQCLTEFRSFSPVIVGNIIVIVIYTLGEKLLKAKMNKAQNINTQQWFENRDLSQCLLKYDIYSSYKRFLLRHVVFEAIKTFTLRNAIKQFLCLGWSIFF